MVNYLFERPALACRGTLAHSGIRAAASLCASESNGDSVAARSGRTLFGGIIEEIAKTRVMLVEKELALAMAGLSTGIYVLTVADGGQYHGMSSSWVTQVSGSPPLFSAAVDNGHFSRAIVARTGVFGLNIVGANGKALEDYFYSARARRADNLSEIEYDLSPIIGVPWLRLAMISIEARVRESFIAGDHTIFVAEPAGVRINSSERPLTSLDLDYVYIGGRDVIARDRSGWLS